MDNKIIIEVLKWVGIVSASGIVSTKANLIFKSLEDSFKKKFLPFFKSEEEVDEYYNTIVNKKSINPKKPNRDLEDIYEEITKNTFDSKFIDEIKKWIIDNKEIFQNVWTISENKSFIIKEQKANRDIINVSGNVTINNKERDEEK